MKSKLILANFALSLLGVFISIVALPWFFIACTMLIRADKAGTMDKINKQFKIDDL